jgi:hypothetical protein
MTIDQFRKHAEKMIKRRDDEIQDLKKLTADVNKRSKLIISCRSLGKQSRARFEHWEDQPGRIHLQSREMNPYYGVKMTKKDAMRLRNWLNIFIRECK